MNLWANYSRRGGSLQAFDAARRDATNIVNIFNNLIYNKI
jgi:hypothetical protein